MGSVRVDLSSGRPGMTAATKANAFTSRSHYPDIFLPINTATASE